MVTQHSCDSLIDGVATLEQQDQPATPKKSTVPCFEMCVAESSANLFIKHPATKLCANSSLWLPVSCTVHLLWHPRSHYERYGRTVSLFFILFAAMFMTWIFFNARPKWTFLYWVQWGESWKFRHGLVQRLLTRNQCFAEKSWGFTWQFGDKGWVLEILQPTEARTVGIHLPHQSLVNQPIFQGGPKWNYHSVDHLTPPVYEGDWLIFQSNVLKHHFLRIQ